MFDMMLSPENYNAIRDERERAIASGRLRRELHASDASSLGHALAQPAAEITTPAVPAHADIPVVADAPARRAAAL